MSSIILEAKSLTKEYKQTLALDHISNRLYYHSGISIICTWNY